MLRRLSGRLRDERGMTLPLALAMLMVLSLTTAGTIVYTSSNQRHSSQSRAEQEALNLAEAGVNNALAVLSHDDTNAADPAALTEPTGTPCPDGTDCFEQTYSTGYVRWKGEWVSEGLTGHWLIDSWGYADNPSPGLADVRRYLKASVSVVANPSQVVNANGWKFVLAAGTSNATTCDMVLTQSAQIDSPMYVAGNLCLRQSSRVYEPDPNDPVWLVVKGKLEVAQGSVLNQSRVGESSSAPITRAEIGGGCTTNISNASHTCNPSSPVLDRVWARELLNTASLQITKPPADYASYYQNSNPGPTKPCNPADANAPIFDNNGVLDLSTGGSVGTISITPATTSYSCIGRDSNGVIVGRLEWNATTRHMVVSGAIYIDGSVIMDNNTLITYEGQATLYLSGTFTLQGGSQRFCAAWVGTDCDFNSWAPNEDMLIVVAQGRNADGDSIIFKNAVQWQGGFYAEGNINLGESSLSEGPMMAQTIKIAQSAKIRPLPPMTSVPVGAPGNPTTQATPQRPLYFPDS
ncbi:MAG: pilus assembly PilX N-terminal domain-containing protein [Gaiellaceae bacterium]